MGSCLRALKRRRGRTGAQRCSCSGCGATRSGLSRRPLDWAHSPDLLAALARDMIVATQQMSRRRGAEVLGASRNSIYAQANEDHQRSAAEG